MLIMKYIGLKVDKIIVFLFEDKSSYLARERQLTHLKRIRIPYKQNEFSTHLITDNSDLSNANY